MAWDLLIDRADLAHTELVDAAPIDPSDGQVVLKVDRVGMTANNVTYAVFGDAMQYWDFFPAGERDGVAYGRVPLWGFAVVERSTVAGVEEGARYFGYLPTSSHLRGRADRCGTEGVPRREPAPPAPSRAVQRAHHHDRRPRVRRGPRGSPDPLPTVVHDELRARRLHPGQRRVRRRVGGHQQRVEQDGLRHRVPARRSPPDRAHQRRAIGPSPRASGATSRSSPTTRSPTCRRPRPCSSTSPGTRPCGGPCTSACSRCTRPWSGPSHHDAAPDLGDAATSPARRRRSSSHRTRCASVRRLGAGRRRRGTRRGRGSASRRSSPTGSTWRWPTVPRACAPTGWRCSPARRHPAPGTSSSCNGVPVPVRIDRSDGEHDDP